LKQIRKRLTYANVMSSIAVFLVVGGATAFAAGHLGKNTVGTKQLKTNAVTTAKIKNGAVTGAKVKAGSLSGSALNLSTLGTVPSATNAANAANANNANTVGGRSVRWLVANPSGSIVSQSGGFSSSRISAGIYLIDAGSTVTGHAVIITNGFASDPTLHGAPVAAPCGLGGEEFNCALFGGPNDGHHILAVTTKAGASTTEDHSFYLLVY
jgi:hypothetical protein